MMTGAPPIAGNHHALFFLGGATISLTLIAPTRDPATTGCFLSVFQGGWCILYTLQSTKHKEKGNRVLSPWKSLQTADCSTSILSNTGPGYLWSYQYIYIFIKGTHGCMYIKGKYILKVHMDACTLKDIKGIIVHSGCIYMSTPGWLSMMYVWRGYHYPVVTWINPDGALGCMENGAV